MTKHDYSYHPAYRIWLYMNQRCNNPNNTGYSLYGGRGIRVCSRWETFEGFWADMAIGWYDGASIDRIDVNGHYEASNCKWSSPKEQANNRRTNRIIDTPRGKMNVSQAATEFGIPRQTLDARLRYGWPVEDLLLPVRPLHRK